MPFGLCNAPATFQRMMDNVLRGLKVFDRFRQAGLHLKAAKCKFFHQQLPFLGHIISPEGIAPDPAKLAAVTDYPAPTDASAVRRFLGFVGYYRRFIANFGSIAEPLTALTRKAVLFHWTDAAASAFQQLKTVLLSHQFAYPDTSMPFAPTPMRLGMGWCIACTAAAGQERVIVTLAAYLPQNATTLQPSASASRHSMQHFRIYLRQSL